MSAEKSKSLKEIEEKLSQLDENSFRYHVLESAKTFKTSWIELGRALYSVWKDKMYKEWGFSTFEAYVAGEVGIRKLTAMKLLRSYYFLEKEEPECLKKDFAQGPGVSQMPSYESVDLLRLAKDRKRIDAQDYTRLKEAVFEKGRDVNAVRKDLSAMIRERQELEPEEAAKARKLATVKRLLSSLKSLKKEIELLKFLPAPLIKETASLIIKIEAEVS